MVHNTLYTKNKSEIQKILQENKQKIQEISILVE